MKVNNFPHQVAAEHFLAYSAADKHSGGLDFYHWTVQMYSGVPFRSSIRDETWTSPGCRSTAPCSLVPQQGPGRANQGSGIGYITTKSCDLLTCCSQIFSVLLCHFSTSTLSLSCTLLCWALFNNHSRAEGGGQSYPKCTCRVIWQTEVVVKIQ